MSKVTASAPGKLMLFGEHAVVYGYPCLVTAVDMRVWVSVALQSEPQIDLDVSTSTRDYTIPVSSLSETKQTFPAENNRRLVIQTNDDPLNVLGV